MVQMVLSVSSMLLNKTLSVLFSVPRLQQMCDAMSPKKWGEEGGTYRTMKEVEELEC